MIKKLISCFIIVIAIFAIGVIPAMATDIDPQAPTEAIVEENTNIFEELFAGVKGFFSNLFDSYQNLVSPEVSIDPLANVEITEEQAKSTGVITLFDSLLSSIGISETVDSIFNKLGVSTSELPFDNNDNLFEASSKSIDYIAAEVDWAFDVFNNMESYIDVDCSEFVFN